MKKTMIALLAASAMATAPLAWSQSMGHMKGMNMKGEKHEAADKTVTGEIVDLACYLSHGAKGAKHAECAKKCLADGSPMGLLTKKGSLFLLVNNHEKQSAYDSAKKLAAKLVKVTGDMTHKGGLKALIVDKVEKVKS